MLMITHPNVTLEYSAILHFNLERNLNINIGEWLARQGQHL